MWLITQFERGKNESFSIKTLNSQFHHLHVKAKPNIYKGRDCVKAAWLPLTSTNSLLGLSRALTCLVGFLWHMLTCMHTHTLNKPSSALTRIFFLLTFSEFLLANIQVHGFKDPGHTIRGKYFQNNFTMFLFESQKFPL